jgi:hypothetical protein
VTRLQHLADLVKAAYAGSPDTTWYVGPEHVHRHDSWNRIVIYTTDGSALPPDVAAQGWQLDELLSASEPDARDDIVFVRRVTVELGIWAQSYAQAENRLHAMLVALERVRGASDIALGNIRERWLRSEAQDITGGGSLVVLAFETIFYVLTGDADVVADAAEIGAGVPTDPIGEIAVAVLHEQQDGSTELVHEFVIGGT